ncbi:unnamed protein product [Phyllotreta striolata]|uniref:C3H1-type domain-containing protein n=1 Tax=Phyllotreta striolata TaxID=444603 RepID=A0A9N9XP26_PHYSR|nr:unnamed protein product [Phyllotreta striolata]
MDSEDSHEASSGSECGDYKPNNEPAGVSHRSRSSSRSSSPASRPRSPSSRSSNDSRPPSPAQETKPQDAPVHSRSPSPDSASSKSRSPELKSKIPTSARSPGVDSGQTRVRGRSSSSNGSSSDEERQKSPANRPSSPSPVKQMDQPRSPSPQSSSSSSSLGSPSRNSNQKREDKSDSSASRESRRSAFSRTSKGSRGARRKARKGSADSDTSYSSVDSSSRRNKAVDTQPEEISDGDIESDHEKEEASTKVEPAAVRRDINISHEDLSDVSDLEDSMGGNSDSSPKRTDVENSPFKNDRPSSPDQKKSMEKQTRPEEGEEQLDFEAEDGECDVEMNVKDKEELDDSSKLDDNEKTDDNSKKEKEELEEGEVTDEDDARPEETEPRPVCRFFSRGQCTWGASCRFLHPGVTDKGNYTMFEMIRPVVPGEFRDERSYAKVDAPMVESAWERGLRTAKEMLRKSIKRKEQDIDFEEKKMNLSLAQEEFDKENGYYGRVASPEPRYVRHVEYPVSRPPEEYYNRRQVMYEPEYAPPPPPRERVRSYRELPSHRMPDYYNSKYEEEPPQQHTSAGKPRGPKPKREVIVQRVESERQAGRGDEWSDPWMRSKETGRRKDSTSGRRRSYSSGSSYSSSSSSRSSSDSSKSSYRSRSRSVRRQRSRSHKGKPVSPSVIVSERKAANERAALMNPPAPKRRAPSPGMMRVSAAANPPAPSREDHFGRNRGKLAVAAALSRINRRKSSKSSSGSSGSSSSESDSSDSSSSSSRDNSPLVRSPAVDLVKAMDALKGNSAEKKQIKLNLKNPVGAKKADAGEYRKVDSAQAKKRPANSPPAGDPKSKKATSRREELLKQLKAVEDAIAKKRSKIN